MTEAPSKPQANVAEFSVSDLSNAIKRALEEGFGYVRLRGEVSGYRGPHSSGHCYFSLKDDKAKIDAVVWRGVWSKLKIKPDEGMEVIATGKISSFPGSSKYQIVIEALEPAGLGALMAQLEERKKRLAAEGLFDEARKRALPFLPRVVGIVTSPTGAVIRDMLHGFAERFPVRVLIWPVRVQGDGSAGEVAAAIYGFNAIAPGARIPRPDVLIVARGGGSLEDLWGFNDEAVVRAVAKSSIPVISAVGHETDWTLIDLVADARAPTPTKAAEWAVPKYSELIAQSADLAARLKVAMRRALETQRSHLKAAARGLPQPHDLVALPRQRFDAAEKRLSRALLANTRAHGLRLAKISSRLPQPHDLVAMPRQRFDAAEKRLSRALLANTRAHGLRLAKISSRLQRRLLSLRIERSGRRLSETFDRGRSALTRIAGERRRRHERIAGRLRPEALANRLDVKRRALESHGKMLVSLSYQSVLARGYALVRTASGTMVRHAAALSAHDQIEVQFKDGKIGAEVTGASPPGPETPGPRNPEAQPPQPRTAKGRQGSLF